MSTQSPHDKGSLIESQANDATNQKLLEVLGEQEVVQIQQRTGADKELLEKFFQEVLASGVSGKALAKSLLDMTNAMPKQFEVASPTQYTFSAPFGP